MTTVSQFAPTGFDHPIGQFLALADKQTWIVAPCTRTRDSSILENTNWDAQLRRLGDESDTLEIHRFGHWACGWYETVIVSPERLPEVEALRDALDRYPLLDEERYSALIWESASNIWREASKSERRYYCERSHVPYANVRRRFENTDDSLRDYLETLASE